MVSINKFIAAGDVHIFTGKRFAEHRAVFGKFYELIDLEKPDLVVLCGDIIDSKLRLSPEQIELCREFFVEILKRCPIIAIPGNHDLSLNTPDRLDSLTPIIASIQDAGLHGFTYIKKSGIYNLYDINWAVWSCIEGQKKPDFSKTISADPLIGLYHGVVSGAVSDSGFALSGGIEISEFDECDLVVMSDIHKLQSFRNNEINYTGSLIQVSVSEEPNGSCLIYERKDKTYVPRVAHIENIHSTITVEPTNLNVSILDTQKMRIRFDPDVYGRTQIAEMAKDLKKKYNVHVDLAPVARKKIVITKTDTKEEITRENVFDHLDAFVAKHREKLEIKNLKEDIEKLRLLDKEFSVGNTVEYEEGDYSVTKIEVSNLLSFGPTPITIPLDDEGLIGLFGKNRVGKSSIIKALQFAKFNELPSNSTAAKAINKYNRNKPANIKIYFTKLGKNYVIDRSILPDPKNKAVKYDLKFHEINVDGSIKVNLTKESRPYTETEIRKYLGINETFEMLSLFSAQKRQTEFIDCKNAERLKLVNKFLSLHHFEVKESGVLEALKEKNAVYTTLLRQFEQDIDINMVEKNIATNDTLVKILQNDETEVQSELGELDYDFAEILAIYNANLSKSLKRVPEPVAITAEIDRLRLEESAIGRKIAENIEICGGLIAKREELVAKFETDFCIHPADFKPDHSKIQTAKDVIAVSKHELAAIDKQLAMTDCNSCGRPFTQKDQDKAINNRQEIVTRHDAAREIIDYNETRNKDANKQIFDIENNMDTVDNLTDRDNVKLESKIKDITIKINSCSLQIAEYDSVQIAKNVIAILGDKVAEYNETKTNLSAKISACRLKINTCRNKNTEWKKKLADYASKRGVLLDMEEEIRLLKSYRKIVNKDGLPLYILNSKIEEINTRVNAIIGQVFDFDLEFSVDETKGELKIQYHYPDETEHNDLGFASGSETFVINLCIKVALAQISTLPKMDTIFIDEGYDSLDSETIDKLPAMFAALAGYYRNVVTISHLDVIKDMCTRQINVYKKDKYTEIS